MDSSSTKVEYAIVDVFTDKRYTGNPLAIVRVPASLKLTQDQKQSIAQEFNLSETTFWHEPKEGDEPNTWTVDIFMVSAELPFAGHPTIGEFTPSANFIISTHLDKGTACYALSEVAQKSGAGGTLQAKFNLKAGPVQLEYDVAKGHARAAIPHNVHIHKRTWSREELLAVQPALKDHVADIQEIPIVSIVKGMTFILIELNSLEALQSVSISGAPVSVSGLDEEWKDTFVGTYFYVRTPGAEGVQSLRTRMIEGTLEDPATGSAASDLAAYLSLTHGKPGQTLEYEITQGVEMGRKSDISVQVVLGHQSGIEKITLGGKTVSVMEGRLLV